MSNRGAVGTGGSRPGGYPRRALQPVTKNWGLYLMLLPAITLTFCFAYMPMYGVIIAFKDYKNALGILASPWSDPLFKHFIKFFNSYQFANTIRNTLTISIYSILVGFPIPILLALLINQMQAMRFRRVFQTITYLPHFISMVVMVGMLLLLLSPSTGLMGALYRLWGGKAPNLMGTATAFSSVYVWSGIWQNAGWDSIIYLAALAATDPSLYEAATVDGAGKLQKMLRIDIPMLLPTVSILLIMRAGGIMNVGFEKAYLMQNELNRTHSELISTYVYKLGLLNSQYSFSAAVSLFNNVINCALLVAINHVTKRISDNSLF